MKVILYCCYDGNFSLSTNVNNICNYLNISAIYVTNLYKEFSNYKINEEFLIKLKPTYLGLGKTNVIYDHHNKIFNNEIEPDRSIKKYDAFFIGSLSKTKRLRSFYFEKISNDPRIKNYKIFLDQYNLGDIKDISNNLNMIKKSNVSIDFSGQVDNLTMRFHEIIFFKGIPISDEGFLKFYLSNYYEEIIEYIVFKDKDYFFYLIDLYQSDRFREYILKKLYRIFSDYYDPSIEGKKILNDIQI